MKTGRRIIGSSVVVAVVVALVALTGTVAILVETLGALTSVDRAFVIDRFDREVTIDARGRADVTETIDVTFREGRRGIFRDLPSQVNGVPQRVAVTSVDRGTDGDDWRWQTERAQNGDHRIRIGDAAITLPPGPQRYRLRYAIEGLTIDDRSREAVAEVRIDVPGDGWPTRVGATSLRVVLPAPPLDVTCVVGRRGDLVPCASAPSVTGSTVMLTVDELEPARTATIAMALPADAFAPGSLPVARTQALGSGVGRRLDVPGWLAGLLVALAITLPIVALETARSWSVYRDRVTDPVLHDRAVPTAEVAPPDALRPAEVAHVQLRTGRSRFLATLIDLEQRGMLASREDVTGTKRRKDRVTTLYRGDTPAGTAWEQRVVDGLFPAGSRSLRLDGDYDATSAARLTAAENAISAHDREMFRAGGGLVHTAGQWLRGGSGALIVLATLIVAVGAGIVMADATGLPRAVAGIATGLVLIGWMILARIWRHHRLPLTSEGRHLTARVRAFRRFLADVHADQLEYAAGRPGIDHLHPAIALLPYAVALDLADSWFARFQPLIDELAAKAPSSGSSSTWWTSSSGVRAFSTTSAATATAPSDSSSGGGGGAGSGGGGGGGGSW